MTGAAGGIGRALVPLLVRRGVDVTAAVRRRPFEPLDAGAREIVADLVTDDLTAMLDGVATVVHLAARSSPWGERRLFERDNVVATSRLLSAARVAGIRRFVFASTPAIFAERRHRYDIGPGDAPAAQPINHYAQTKLLAERAVIEENGMSTMVIRPSAVLGKGDRAIMPRLWRVIRRGWLPLGNGGGAMFHPTDMRDAAAAFEAAAMRDTVGVVNVAGRRPVLVAEMAAALAEKLRIDLRMPHVPEAMLHGAACATEWLGYRGGREPALTRYSVSTLSWSRTFSLESAEQCLGWHPAFGPADILAEVVSS